jgi:hypothetical protein
VWARAPARDAPQDDPLILAGIVHTAPNGQAPTANIVCERQEGRLQWFLLQFKAHALLRSEYEFGPSDQLHGLNWPVFAQQRPYMRQSGVHVFTTQRAPLTPKSVIQLLHDAIGY